MFALEFDFRQFQDKARQVGVFADDQLPYAISRTLNHAVFDARREVVTVVWPSKMRVFNASFINAAMRVTTSSKGSLSVSLYDALHRASLALHADGGTKGSKGALALPNRAIIGRTAAGHKPRPRQLNLAPHMARGHMVPSMHVIKGKGIFVGEGGRLVLAYSFKPSAGIKKDFPFYETFKRVIESGVTRYYPPNLAAAVRTAFR